MPDDRDALLLLALIQQNFGSLCRELATMGGLIDLLPRRPFPEGGEHPLSSYRWVGGSVRLSGDFRGGREP